MMFLGFILVFFGGAMLGVAGICFDTWQYYAIAVPLIFGAMIVGAAK